VKVDRGVVGRLAHRLCGSPDLYGHKGREAEQSINFITCHHGFTLNDLVSYSGKHNEAGAVLFDGNLKDAHPMPLVVPKKRTIQRLTDSFRAFVPDALDYPFL
jgi:hypothetical protein